MAVQPEVHLYIAGRLQPREAGEGDGVVAGGEAAEDPGGDVQETVTATCTQGVNVSRSH